MAAPFAVVLFGSTPSSDDRKKRGFLPFYKTMLFAPRPTLQLQAESKRSTVLVVFVLPMKGVAG